MAEAEVEMKYEVDDHFWNRRGYDYYGSVCCDHPVGRESFEIQKKVSRLEAENSLLRSENDSERKMVEVYTSLDKKINENGDRDSHRWTEQLVWNAHQEARLAVIESKLRQLMSITDLYVNARRVTPLPMERYNNWEIPPVNEPAP